MTVPNFKSALAACLSDFIGYKQALNCKYRTEANVLQMFDQYLCDHSVSDCESIDTTVIEGFLKSRPRRTASRRIVSEVSCDSVRPSMRTPLHITTRSICVD